MSTTYVSETTFSRAEMEVLRQLVGTSHLALPLPADLAVFGEPTGFTADQLASFGLSAAEVESFIAKLRPVTT